MHVAMKRSVEYLRAARPATLGAAVIPVAVGSAVASAHHGFRLDHALYALFGAVLIQIGTNYANDLFDARSGADNEARLGPTRAVAAGIISDRAMLRAMFTAFALALLCGVPLVAAHGWPVALLGLASIGFGIAYTGGPYPLGYHGLGDPFVFLFFGVAAVAGTAFVQLGFVPTIAWLAALPIGALATVILAVNNLRDHETDARANKRTLAVRWGPRAVRVEITALLVFAYVVPLFAWRLDGSVLVLLPLATAPLMAKIVRDTWSVQGRALNQTLLSAATLLVGFGASFSVGIALGG